MQGVVHPIKVRAENIGIRLQDASGSGVNERLKAGEEVVINNSAINKLIVSSDFIPETYSLEQNYPNPFNPTTKLIYSITRSCLVTLKVFDVLGTEIETLVNEEKPVGTYKLNWNAADLPSGVYFYRLQAGDFLQTRKMILLK